MELPSEAEAQPEPSSEPRRSRVHGFSELGKTLLFAALVFIGARTIVLPYEVEGASMTPNLHDHERVLVNRTVYFHFDLNRIVNLLPGVELAGSNVVYPFHAPERGDVVVLEPPVAAKEPYIKRVIGLPGERVTFANGYVYVDGVRLDEAYIPGPITTCGGGAYCDMGPIPEGYVYVLGDNREASSDSRSFGLVAIEQIVGEAWFTNWPLDDFGLMPSYDYETSR
jgi:signal peptidase I